MDKRKWDFKYIAYAHKTVKEVSERKWDAIKIRTIDTSAF